MSKRRKNGGRHASVGDDRYISAAKQGLLETFPAARVIFSRVIPKAAKSGVPGTWRMKHSAALADGGVPVLLFSYSCTVEARVYVGGARTGSPTGVVPRMSVNERSSSSRPSADVHSTNR